MKKLLSTVTLLSLLSACGNESTSTNQIAPPDMAPSVSAQAKKTTPARKPLIRKNEISTDTFSPFVKMVTPMKVGAKPELQVFIKVKSNSNEEYDNSEKRFSFYQVFFDSESINDSGNLKLGKDGILYLEHTVRSNVTVITDDLVIEYFPMGTYSKKASFKSGDSVAFKLDDGNSIKMRWKMGEISREGIDIYVKDGLRAVKVKPELF